MRAIFSPAVLSINRLRFSHKFLLPGTLAVKPALATVAELLCLAQTLSAEVGHFRV